MEQGQHPPTEPTKLEPTTPARTPRAFRPTTPAARIEALDVARGFALLGIFFVNVHMMAEPMGAAFAPDLSGVSPLDKLVHVLTATLFQSKSYPLFSMLFGMGMALMYDRAKAAGRSFYPVYLRRIAMLLIMGLAHAFLLWYGDILAIYALTAFVVMWFIPFRPRVLLAIAGGCLGLSIFLALALGLLGALGGPPPAGDTEPITPDAVGVHALLEAFPSGQVDGPAHPIWMDAESVSFAQGPYADAVLMRAINWFSTLLFWIVAMGGGLHIAAMFLLGAGLIRSGFFSAAYAARVRTLAIISGLVGLPASAVIAWAFLHHGAEPGPVQALAFPALLIFGPAVSLLYLSLATLAAHKAPRNPLVLAIAAAGRMALTNYIAQTVVVAIIMQHWGLGRFGTFAPAALAGIVIAVYAAQLVLSSLWLRVFRMGPLEWCWRGWTYLRVPSLLRPPAAAS